MKPISSFHAPALIEEVVKFDCIVKGKNLQATIVEELENFTSFSFKIRFSDHAEVIVLTSELSGWIADDFKQTAYVKSVANQLQDFLSVKQYEWNYFKVKFNSQILLVWVCRKDTEEHGDHFDIHFAGDYQFSLKKVKDKWHASSKRIATQTGIQEPLAIIISEYIDRSF